jgi:NitT/TauT family transport system ATP-binding protein
MCCSRCEPFSALDVLTAETLRTDFLDLWIGHKLPLQTVLLVTHNIEEAVLLCDRILVLASNPGRICAEIPITLAHPRDRLGAEFRAIVDEIYSILTLRSLESIRNHAQPAVGVALPLPLASVNQISGLLETLLSPHYGGRADMPELARTLALEVDDLFPIAEAIHILGFAELTGRSLKLTAAGKLFAEGATDERKRLWREHLLQFVPLASHIHRVLEERQVHWAPRSRFETELEDHLTRQEATRTLRAVTGWGRYAELFSYDAKLRRFTST